LAIILCVYHLNGTTQTRGCNRSIIYTKVLIERLKIWSGRSYQCSEGNVLPIKCQ